MANSGRVEINSSVTDSLCSVHGIIYVILYGRIRIPRISGILAHAETVCTRLSFPPTKESLGSRLVCIDTSSTCSSLVILDSHHLEGVSKKNQQKLVKFSVVRDSSFVP